MTSELLSALSAERIQADVEHLVAFGTRESGTPQYRAAACWAAGQLVLSGVATQLETIMVESTTNGTVESCNVVGFRPGTGEPPRESMLVTAHLDSIGCAPGAPAPGADDNATGVAGVLELARCLASRTFVPDLYFVLFGGEEENMAGSKQYVMKHQATLNIRGVVNMDMIGFSNVPSERSLMIDGVSMSEWMTAAIAKMAHTYTCLRVQVPRADDAGSLESDHMSFIHRSIPAVLLIEGNSDSNRRIHSAKDTADDLDYSLSVDILRAALAFLAETARVEF